ncbi:PilZ domain-containing protein [Oligoflexaceae bacterium]|nr:PilZ domain-containing protein [Oligoflexaceae bacterium]
MSEQLWYVYQQNQQIGPFTKEVVLQMMTTKMIAHDAYLFKVGWKDWRPIEESQEELGLPSQQSTVSPEEAESRRLGAPRATIRGRVIVHNDGQLAIGEGVNISESGLFVETVEQLFTVGEKLKISVRAEGINKPFNAVAHVIRFNSDSRFPVGYGLELKEIDAAIKAKIKSLVDEQNKGQGRSQVAR